MRFDIKQKGQKSNRDKTLIRLLKLPAIMASVFSTLVLSSDPNDLCDGLNLLPQETQAGNNYILTDRQFVALVDKSLEFKFISKKQHKQIFINCDLI